MNYQILVLDLDGTLTNSKKQITPPTQKALIDIQEKGKKVVLASGRPTNGVAPLADQLHLQEYGSYILSFNGGRITDCRSKEVIYNRILPPEVILPAYEIVKKYLEHDINIITYTSGEGEDSRDWTVFATDTGTCTYLYAFCEAPEAAEDMEEIYQSIFAQLHWSDAE